MTKLPQKDGTKVTPMVDMIHYKPKPGMLVFFAYVPHNFVDMGVDDFRFIHFNLQAVRNDIVGSAKRNEVMSKTRFKKSLFSNQTSD